MNMYICMKINYINSPFIKFKVMAALCSNYFIGYAGLPRRTTGMSGRWASICTILFPNNTVSHFSYAPLFKGPHLLTKMLESNILHAHLLIGILSV